MEVIVDLLDLCQVLLLHAATSFAFGAVLRWVWEEDLIDYNVMDINVLFGQLDGKSLSLIHGEEFRDAHSHESSLV